MFSRRAMFVWMGIIIFSGMLFMGQPGWAPQQCANFQDPYPSTQPVGNTFTDSGYTFVVKEFLDMFGTPHSGQVNIELGDCAADGSPAVAFCSNANITYTPGFANGLTLRYWDHGGSLDIQINSERRQFEDFSVINGTVIGGTTVTCSGVCGEGGIGTLMVAGPVNEFHLGGQELCVDFICPIN